MWAIRIRDLTDKGFLAFDLTELLRAAGSPALASQWMCRGLWCTSKEPPLGTNLEAYSDTGSPIPGSELARLAAGTRQVIDGTFEAYRAGESAPWLIFKAIDSSYWDARTDSRAVLQQLRRAFGRVEDLPVDAA